MLQNVAIQYSVCLLCMFILITWTDQIWEDIRTKGEYGNTEWTQIQE